MKSLIALSLTLFFTQAVTASEYVIDPEHSSVEFKIGHLASKVPGNFKKFEGKLNYDAKSPEKSTFQGTVKVDSIDTRNEKRDSHLKSPDFFDAANHPNIEFKSKSVKSAGKDKLKIDGDLTMRGVTKPITLNAEVLGKATSPQGNEVLGMTATGRLNRKDFGILWNKLLDHGGAVLKDEVDITIEVEGVNEAANKAKPKK